jgi:hypothetical protein
VSSVELPTATARGEWILERTMDQGDEADFVGELARATSDATWKVVNPTFLHLDSEEAHEAHALPHERGHPAYRFTGSKLWALVGDGAIGFDWTDLYAVTADDQPLLDISCLGSTRWQARTGDERLAHILVAEGFEAMDEAQWLWMGADRDDSSDVDPAKSGVGSVARTFLWIFLVIPMTLLALGIAVLSMTQFPEKPGLGVVGLGCAVLVGWVFPRWMLGRLRQ